MLEHAVAEVGDGELARRSQQQPLAELRLERSDASRNGRFRQPHAGRGAAEAALVDDAGEQHQVIRLEVHDR